MEKGLSSSSSEDLLSHPDKLLSDHLINVAKLAGQFFEESKCPLTDRAILSEVVKLMGLTHDIGKATSFFQKLIRETNFQRQKELKNDPRSSHSLISAIITYWLIDDLVKNSLKEKDELMFLPYITFFSVKHHHGNLDYVLKSIILDRKSINTMIEQWQDMNTNKFRTLLCLLGISNKYEYINNKFLSIDEKTLCKTQLRKILKNIDSFKQYYLTNILYSILIDSDKTDAGIRQTLPERREIDPDLVDKYREKREWLSPESKIDKLRNQVYIETNLKIENMDLNNHILSMNVPTGLGKTLSAFNCALKLRRKIKTESGYTPRIIYALPFLSIIEQNFEEIEKVVGQKVDTSLLMKHHHLSDIFYLVKKEDEEYSSLLNYAEEGKKYNVNESELLIESWNSEIIITTFVQLFHTIIGYRNRALKKFHRISKSIIILDEIQSLPYKYWMLLKEAISFMCKEMQVYFVIVTATKPLIFSDDEVYDLVSDVKYYFNSVDRIELYVDTTERMGLEDFREKLKSEIIENPNKSFLVVMNTIRSAKEIYDWLKVEGIKDISYLSTHVIPKHRLERIKMAKDGKIRILISTQLVEAGVDIDFDIVYRDFAPLDSINQTAGRCNRNMNSKAKGLTKVVRLVDQNNRYYSSYIYDEYLINKTENIMRPGMNIGENEFISKNNSYYILVNKDMSNQKSKDIIKSIYYLDYDSQDNSISKFRLIDEGYEKIDIFVEFDKEAEDIWKKYDQLQSEKNWKDRHEKFLRIRSCFYNYVISVSLNYAKENLPPLVNGIRYISNAQLDDYYFLDIGFKSKSGSSIF